MPAPAPRTVLYVMNSASMAGANRSLAVLLAGLDRGRFRPIAVLPKEGTACERLRALAVPFHILPLPGLARLRASAVGKARAAARNARNLVRLANLARRERVRLVHTNTIFPLGGALVARLLGQPHVWHVREGLDWPGYDLRFGRAVSRWLIGALSDRIVCISGYVRQASIRERDGDKALVVDNALETLPPAPRSARLARPVIGCLGLISRQKRTDLFVEAAGLIAASHPGARFLVAGRPGAGEEAFAASCRTRAAALGLAERMEWPGFVADAVGLFAGLDLLIHPAVHEGFGRVVMEAMACGIPVVGVRSGATPEIVEDAVTGRLVEPDDAAALARAALQLLGDEAAYQDIAAAARRQALERFDPARHVRALTDLYDELLGRAMTS